MLDNLDELDTICEETKHEHVTAKLNVKIVRNELITACEKIKPCFDKLNIKIEHTQAHIDTMHKAIEKQNDMMSKYINTLKEEKDTELKMQNAEEKYQQKVKQLLDNDIISYPPSRRGRECRRLGRFKSKVIEAWQR